MKYLLNHPKLFIFFHLIMLNSFSLKADFSLPSSIVNRSNPGEFYNAHQALIWLENRMTTPNPCCSPETIKTINNLTSILSDIRQIDEMVYRLQFARQKTWQTTSLHPSECQTLLDQINDQLQLLQTQRDEILENNGIEKQYFHRYDSYIYSYHDYFFKGDKCDREHTSTAYQRVLNSIIITHRLKRFGLDDKVDVVYKWLSNGWAVSCRVSNALESILKELTSLESASLAEITIRANLFYQGFKRLKEITKQLCQLGIADLAEVHGTQPLPNLKNMGMIGSLGCPNGFKILLYDTEFLNFDGNPRNFTDDAASCKRAFLDECGLGL